MEMHRLYTFQGSALYRIFDQSVRDNDLETLKRLCKDGFEDVDSATDNSGMTLYHSAIDYGNIDALRILVENQVPMFNDGFFHAVTSGNPEMVRVFADKLSEHGNVDTRTIYPQNSCYPANATPLMMAATLKDLKAMKILIDSGHVFPEMEDLLKDCDDDYHRALRKVEWYRARCSDGLIVLSSEDPLAMTFELAGSLKKEYIRYPELNEQLEEIAHDLGLLARDLMKCTHTKREATILLEVGRKIPIGRRLKEKTCKHCRKHWSAPPRINNGLSLNYKEFITINCCQEYMMNRLYDSGQSGPRWRWMSTPVFFLSSMMICVSSPILWVMFLFPFSRLKRYLNSPYVRFLSHLTSNVIFLLLLIFTTVDVEIIVGMDDSRTESLSEQQKYHLYKGLQLSANRWFVFVWIIGMLWQNLHLLWRKGARAYFREPWHVVDYLQSIFYVAFITSFTMANYWSLKMSQRYTTLTTVPMTTVSTTVTVPTATPMPDANTTVTPILIAWPPPQVLTETVILSFRNMTRFDWDTYDPVFVCEATFAIANILTFIRMIHTCVMLKFLGPLKISIEGMLVQTIKFLVIFSFVWISFAMGFSQLYRGFQILQLSQCEEDCGGIAPFINLQQSMSTLFWSLFDLPDLSIFETPSKGRSIIQEVGFFLYAAYSVVAVLIMLNALIAMMSNHYTRIEENAEMEWRFARTEYMVDYLEHMIAIPPPLNVVEAGFTFIVYTFQILWKIHLILRGRKQKKPKRVECDCMERYEKTIHSIRIRYLQERFIEIYTRERAEQRANRMERSLNELRSNMAKVTADTDRILAQLQGSESSQPDLTLSSVVGHDPNYNK